VRNVSIATQRQQVWLNHEWQATCVFAASAAVWIAFEEIGQNGGVGGVLVWVFAATTAASGEEIEANVSAATGEIVRLQTVTSDEKVPIKS